MLKTERKHRQVLESELQELRSRTDPMKIPNHHYPVQLILLAICVVQNHGSLRCAAAVVECMAQLMGWSYDKPSPTTVSTWVKRCGLDVLQQVQSLYGEVVLILDESISIGLEKILLALAVFIPKDGTPLGPLHQADTHVVGLEVQPSWNGAEVADFLERIRIRFPNLAIKYMVSDRGTALLAAVRTLEIDWVGDCTHEMMNIVKRLFKDDKALSTLCHQIGELRRQCILTKYSLCLPPTLRDKDRFLRIFTIVEWANWLDQYWPVLDRETHQRVAFYQQAWLLRRLRQVHQLVELTSKVLKHQGISTNSYGEWQAKVAEFLEQHRGLVTHQARYFITRIHAYYARHLPLSPAGSSLLCCSDVLEGTFGTYKNKRGMKVISGDVLAIPLYGKGLTTHDVIAALGRVSGKDVEEWEANNVCPNRYGLRKDLNRRLKTVT
jgi:hypothetical protein